jgi:hypothetical protein
MPADIFDGRSEMSAEEYVAWRAAGSPSTPIPPAPDPAAPDWRTNEKRFLQKVVDKASELGWLSYHTWNSANSAPGFPDLFLVRRGRALAFELKIPPRKPTAAQTKWLRALEDAGIETHVFTPDDWPMIEEVLA